MNSSDMKRRARQSLAWGRAIQRRYLAINGRTLAAGVTLYSFLALFAIIVLAVAVLGFLSVSRASLGRDIAADLGLTGDARRTIVQAVAAARRSRGLTTILGLGGLVWLGTTWTASMADAYNAAWGVPGRGLRDRARGLLWLLGATVILGVSSLATAGWTLLPGAFAPLVIIVSLATNLTFWLWTSWYLPNRPVTFRVALVPGIVGAIALEVLKVASAYLVPHYVARSSGLYGVLGTVIALLLWLLIFGRIVVYLAVMEAQAAGVHAVDSTRVGISQRLVSDQG